MIRRKLILVPGPPQKLEFHGLDAAFDPFRIDIPILTTDGLSLPDFTDRVDNEVRKSCKSDSCLGRAALTTLVLYPTDRASPIMVDGADIICNSDRCPLGGPPDGGDREPILGTPPQPSLTQGIQDPSLV